jgi:prophage DNA circulation protein
MANSPSIPPGLASGSTQPSGSGNTSNLQSALTPDEMASLLPLVIKKFSSDPGISFPCVMFREEQTKDLAVHKYPNLDGARVENMGSNPAIFHVKAILTNNIYPGLNENWKPGTLFPSVFGEIINLLNDPGNKIIQHPIYGDLSVQVSLFNYELNPVNGPRDGLYLEIHFIETIDDNVPISQQLSTTPAGINQSAIALDNAIAAAPTGLNPPNLTLSQMFGKVANIITSTVQFPNNVVTAVNLDILTSINGSAGIAAAIGRTPSYTYNNTLSAIQNTKSAVRTAEININNAYNYDNSTAQATRSLISLNYTPSQNSFQFMDKTMRALIDLMQHYINQLNSFASPIIAAIRQLLFQIQVLQNQLARNSNNQNILVRTYVTQNNVSWAQLSKILNNTIDDLLGLNLDLLTDIWIPQYTTIKYFQS